MGVSLLVAPELLFLKLLHLQPRLLMTLLPPVGLLKMQNMILISNLLFLYLNLSLSPPVKRMRKRSLSIELKFIDLTKMSNSGKNEEWETLKSSIIKPKIHFESYYGGI